MIEYLLHKRQGKQTVGVIFFFLTACFFILHGCMGGKPTYEIEKYLLYYPAPTFENHIRLDSATIRFNRFSIASAYNTQNMIFRTDNYNFDFFNYNRWAVNPADMVTDFLLRDMQSSSLFYAVFSRYVAEEGRFLLQGNVEEFFLNIEKNNKVAVLCIEITLIDSNQREATKRIIFQKKYYQKEPLTEQSPRGYCQAMSQDMQNLSRQIISDVYQAIKTVVK